MTPKEKAEELVSKHYNRIEHTLSEEYEPHALWLSKQCALIAVDEILNEIHELLESSESLKIKWKQIWYNQVKQEIEKL